jgi:integrase
MSGSFKPRFSERERGFVFYFLSFILSGQKSMIRKITVLAAALLQLSLSFLYAQNAPLLKIGPKAVWKGNEKRLMQAVNEKCRNQEPGRIGECLYCVLKEEGASSQALDFVNRINKDGYLNSYRQAGPVGIAYTTYPFRANENHGYLLVNGNPPSIDVDDISILDQKTLEKDPTYGKLKRLFPDIMLWGGNRHGKENIQKEALPEGGVRLIFIYRFLNGCRACRILGRAWIAFDFDNDGTFKGTKLLRTKSLVKIDRKSPRR